jgi:Fic family protein
MQLKELFEKIDSLKIEIDKLRPLKPEEEQRITQKFRLDWNFHSNAIEGNSLTLGETKTLLMHGLTAGGKKVRDADDIRGHDDVLKMLPKLIADKHRLTEADIKNMHRDLLREPYFKDAIAPDGKIFRLKVRLGEYKQERNIVHTPTGETHEYVRPEDVTAKMHDLLQWHREREEKRDIHPVEHSALFHHRFEAIHPFDDGNGRMGRILMNLILMQSGFPPVIIKVEDRNHYVASLAKADAHEFKDLVEFIARTLVDSETLYLRGARGESIEDNDDLDKKVTLFKQEVRDAPKPVELTPKIQGDFLRDKFLPLLDRIDKKVRIFDDLFAANLIELHFTHTGSTEYVRSFPRKDAAQVLLHLYESALRERDANLQKGRIPAGDSPGPFNYLRLTFRWNEFQRAGTNDFSVGTEIEIAFAKNKFQFSCTDAGINAPFLYQDWLTEDQIRDLVSSVANIIFLGIQERTKPRQG